MESKQEKKVKKPKKEPESLKDKLIRWSGKVDEDLRTTRWTETWLNGPHGPNFHFEEKVRFTKMKDFPKE